MFTIKIGIGSDRYLTF